MSLESDATPPTKRYDTVRRLLSRLDRQTRARLLDHLADSSSHDGHPASPMRLMLLQLLSSRRRAHTRRLWARWLEPVMLRDPALLTTHTPLPGCIRTADLSGWWTALSRRMGDTPSEIQTAIEDRLLEAPLDRVMASDEAARWSDLLRFRSLAVLREVRNEPASLASFLDDANAERLRSNPSRCWTEDKPPRALDIVDFDTLATALRVSPAWRRLPGRAALMEVDDLLATVRDALTGGGVPPDAMAFYAVAGLYAHRDPLLGAALRALLPLPLVEAAVSRLADCGDEIESSPTDVEPLRAGQARGLDHGLRALFDTATASGHPLTPAEAKRLGRALAGVVDVRRPPHAPAVR